MFVHSALFAMSWLSGCWQDPERVPVEPAPAPVTAPAADVDALVAAWLTQR